MHATTFFAILALCFALGTYGAVLIGKGRATKRALAAKRRTSAAKARATREANKARKVAATIAAQPKPKLAPSKVRPMATPQRGRFAWQGNAWH